MQTGKVYRNLAVVEQKFYSYLARFKNVAFHAKFFLRTTTKGPPPRCLPRGPHHPRSTPEYSRAVNGSENYLEFFLLPFSIQHNYIQFTLFFISCKQLTSIIISTYSKNHM